MELEFLLSLVYIVVGYLLGMAFAGSFLGRKYMGLVDITLHKIFRRRVTIAQYLYWRYFCGIENPPKPKNLKRAESYVKALEAVVERLMGVAAFIGRARPSTGLKAKG